MAKNRKLKQGFKEIQKKSIYRKYFFDQIIVFTEIKGITKRRNSGPELWNIPPEFFDFFAKKFRRNLLKDGMFHQSP